MSAPPTPLDVTAETLARRLLDVLPGTHGVARADLDRLPSPVARVVRARLDARLDREAALPSTPWLDREHPAAREAATAWRAAARTAAHVPAAAWPDLLANAAHQAVSHLVRPAETLASSAFVDTDEPLPTPLALDRLAAFEPYPYLPEIAERYVEKKGLAHIDREGLERLLDRIDSRMVAGFQPDDWTALLTPLFDLLGGTLPASLVRQAFEARGRGPVVASLDGDEVTLATLRAHLDDTLSKPDSLGDATDAEASSAIPAPSAPPPPAEPEPEQTGDARTPEPDVPEPDVPEPDVPEPDVPEPDVPEPAGPDLPDRRSNGSRPPLSQSTAPRTFEVEALPTPLGRRLDERDSEDTGEASPVEVMEPFAPLATTPNVPPPVTDAVVTETTETAPDDEPLWKRLANGPTGASAAPLSAPSPPPAAQAAGVSGGTPLWAQFSPDKEGAASAPGDATPARDAPPTERSLDALETSVLGGPDTDRRAWYVHELFSDDEASYRATLARLDGARTWTEATSIIAEDVFRAHKVNIYSDPAVTFTDAVEAGMEAR